jgi:CheY-like chemotaxis protein
MVRELGYTRRELEETWRSRVDEARRRYSAANGEYRRLLGGSTHGVPPEPDSALAHAREAESDALADLTRTVQDRGELTVRSKLPEQPLALNLVTVIDDDESIRDSLKALLRSAGFRVAAFESAEAFLDSDTAMQTSCLILDFRMPGISGLDLQLRLNSSNFRIPIIFITAHADRSFHERAIQAGAVEILHKPFAPTMLLSTLQAALESGEKRNA